MKVNVTEVNSYQRRLQFVVPAASVRSELDQHYKRLSKRVRIPGFRPGRAPRQVLEARFAESVNNDVVNALIQRSYTSALSSENIEPVGRPSVDDAGELSKGSDFEFSILVEVKPSITVDTFKGVEVVYPTVEVADEEVEQAVRGRLEGQAKLAEVTDRGVEKGDMVLVELIATEGDEEVAHEPGTMIRTESDPYFPGIEDELVGLKVGDEKKASVTFADGARTAAVAGKTLDVTIKVMSIQANEVPELSDELAEELGYEGGAEGMKAAIQSQIHERRDSLARNQARANLLEVLIAKNPFDVPSGMVDGSLQMLMDELRLQQAYAGRDPRTVSFSDAQVADLRVRAEFAAKAGLILDFISTENNIEVTDADLDSKYQELADARGQTIEAVKGYFQKDEAVEELRARLLEEKTLDWLLEQAKLVAPSEAPAAAAAPAAEAPAAEASGEADLSVLDQAVGKVKEALADGSHDAHLAELLAAEEAGKARKGAIAAIKARM